MKKLASALALTAGVLAASQASALSFSLGGYVGPIDIKFQNFESFSGPLAPGVQNFGILSITSIVDPNTATTLWTQGSGGAELTGVFNGITVLSVAPSGGGFDVQSTGGLLNLYLNPVGSLAGAGGPAQGLTGYTDAGCAPNTLCYDGITNAAGGSLFLSLAFASGIDSGNPAVTVDGTFDASTVPTTGDAASYLNVTGGAYANNFDTNGQATAFGPRDIFSQNDFCPNGATGCASVGLTGPAPWQLISNDPVRALFIPEPGTLALFGLGLLGFAGLRRKKVA